ncbi:hypothetical protein Tco_0183485 [Tanacetum coccineum]
MTTLAEFMIIAGADNRPPMLEKSLYDSWKSRMELYIENRENGRMILNSKLQADCDLKATNIVLQCLPPDVYAIVNHHKVAKEIWDRVKLLLQGTKLSLKEKECKLYDEFDKFSFVKGLVVPVFNQRDDPVACLNKAIQFYAGTGYKGNATSSGGNNTYGRQGLLNDIIAKIQAFQTVKLLRQPSQIMLLFQTEDLDAYDSNCDDVSNAKAVLMANLSNYGFDVISEVPHSEPYHIDMDNQSVHAMQDFKQTSVVDFSDNEIMSDSNIISYSQYLQQKYNKQLFKILICMHNKIQ